MRRLAAAWRAHRNRARADRALDRLARENCGNPQCPTCRALDHIAHNGDTGHSTQKDTRP